MYAMFPIELHFGENPCDGIGGPAVDDAGTLYVLRDEENDDDYPQGNFDAGSLVFKTSLAELVAEILDGWRTCDGFTEDAHVPASDALAAALRAAADMLDAGKRPNTEKIAAKFRSGNDVPAPHQGTEMTTEPDFKKLRRERDEAVQRSMQKIADEFGCRVDELRTNYRPGKCYCACASGGPCEHQWNGDGLDLEDGWTATCSRCGATAISHDMRNLP